MRTALVSLLLLAGRLGAAEIAAWEAGEPARSAGISLIKGKRADYHIRKEADRYFASIVPVDDHYRRAVFLVQFDKRPAGEAWLTAEYLDRGYALISMIPHVEQTAQWGVSRVNTGKVRKAVFQLDRAAFAQPLRIQGIEQLCALRLTDRQPEISPQPLVTPSVKLEKPIELVTSAIPLTPTVNEVPRIVAGLRNQLPLVRALGFEGVESYVKWSFVERAPGVFDWSYYDAIVGQVEKHGLKWFPLLVAGPSYTLPDWYHDSPENVGYVCLEHRMGNDIQTIFSRNMDKYVPRFLMEFGKHYGPRKILLGVRLGVSGTYGETQYPASGSLSYHDVPIHQHIGYWAADPLAVLSFRKWTETRYGEVAKLNAAWKERLDSFDKVETFPPLAETNPRKRVDFSHWYFESMDEWSNRWMIWAREAMPDIPIYQSAGGSGQIPVGTDYPYHARSAAGIHGGVRITNEGDDYLVNFAGTRLSASSTRFYGARFALEPASFLSVRGVVARLYNAITTGADHLFYYGNNLEANDQAIGAWQRYAPLLDRRAKPMMDIAMFYPDAEIMLRDTGLNDILSRARALRAVADFDYVNEQMASDGALDRYRVLILPMISTTEKAVAERIARWVEGGGTLIAEAPDNGAAFKTVEGDSSIARRLAEHPGKGHVVLHDWMEREPVEYYVRFVREALPQRTELRPPVRKALRMEKPDSVFWSVLENGGLALLNFSEKQATVRLDGEKPILMEPFSIVMR